MHEVELKQPVFSEEKFRELIVYIASRCQYDQKAGDTKLNKILFYSDFMYYAKHGRPITGEEYLKQQFGPISKHLKAVREVMDGHDLHVFKRPLLRYEQTRTIPTREANLRLFEAAEIEMIDYVIDALRHHDAESVSELTHMLKGWQMTPTGGTIPYESVFLPDKQDSYVSEHELGVLKRLAGV